MEKKQKFLDWYNSIDRDKDVRYQEWTSENGFDLENIYEFYTIFICEDGLSKEDALTIMLLQNKINGAYMMSHTPKPNFAGVFPQVLLKSVLWEVANNCVTFDVKEYKFSRHSSEYWSAKISIPTWVYRKAVDGSLKFISPKYLTISR